MKKKEKQGLLILLGVAIVIIAIICLQQDQKQLIIMKQIQEYKVYLKENLLYYYIKYGFSYNY